MPNQDDLQLLPAIEAIEERDRIEAVAEIPQVRQQEDAAGWHRDPVARRIGFEPVPERTARIAEMIPIVEARPVPAVVARYRRHAHQLRHAIDVEQRHEQRVREGVRDGREPPMAQGADEESRVDHHSTPSARATLTAEFNPSS
jgi:hypothetical protein